MKLAVQLYSLRHDYETGEEFLKILEKVKEIGFDGVEFAGFAGLEPEIIKAKLDELGLSALSELGNMVLGFKRKKDEGDTEHLDSMYKKLLIIAWPAALEGMLLSLMNAFDTMILTY